MPGKITIYRVTNPGDNLGNIGAGEKFLLDIDVNPALKTAHCHDYSIGGDRDVAKNSITDQDLGEHQDTGFDFFFLYESSKCQIKESIPGSYFFVNDFSNFQS